MAELRNFTFRLVAYMCLSDFINSLSYLIGLSSHMCEAQAGLTQFFSLATWFWMACFSFNITRVLVYQDAKVESYEKYYHIISWGIPSFFLILNASLQTFGQATLWCWIRPEFVTLRVVSFYVPLLLVVLFNIGCYWIMRNSKELEPVQRRMLQYIIVFVFVRFWSLLNRLQNIIEPNNPVFALFVLHGLFSPLQGLGNSLVFGLTAKVREQYAKLCCLPTSSPSFHLGTNGDSSSSENHAAVFKSQATSSPMDAKLSGADSAAQQYSSDTFAVMHKLSMGQQVPAGKTPSFIAALQSGQFDRDHE